MTDSMNFGPEWLRNLSSEGTTTGLAGGGGGIRCQLADYRYGREEMLALFERGLSAPPSLSTFTPLFSDQGLLPLALLPATDDDRQWLGRGAVSLGISSRGRGAPGSGERGGRISRGAGRGGSYAPYTRTIGGFENTIGGGGSWGTSGEPTDWSPRKDFTYARNSTGGIDNWRRNNRGAVDEEDGWRNSGRPHSMDKWSRSNASWRENDEEKQQRWHEPPPPGTIRNMHNNAARRSWDMQHDEHLPEWATTENLEGGGTFDASGAFHGSDDDSTNNDKVKMKELQKSASQQNIRNQRAPPPLLASKSAVSLANNNRKVQPPLQNESRENDVQENGAEITSNSNETTAGDVSPTLEPAAAAAPPDEQQPPAPGADEEDFDKLQEDFVSKLVVDEEPSKNAVPTATTTAPPPNIPLTNGGVPPPPPNLPLMQEKWFYQDPQGDLQGPFLSSEMAEWYKAGYFTPTLFVRRQCDDRFYTLGELVTSCNGNPFLLVAPMKDLPAEVELNSLHYQQAQQQQQQFLIAQLMRARGFEHAEPWNNLPGFQRPMFTPQGLLPGQVAMPPPPSTSEMNPLLQHVLNQFKMQAPPPPPPPALHIAALDEANVANMQQLDPLRALVQQMGGLQHKSEPPNMPMNGTLPHLAAAMAVTNSMKHENDMLLKHFIQQQQQHANVDQRIDLDSLWKHPQFQQQPPPPSVAPPPTVSQTTSATSVPAQSNPQWPQTDLPISMWDAKTVQSVFGMLQSSAQQQEQPSAAPKNGTEKKSKRDKEEAKDVDEKLAAKVAIEEKRKAEQRKLEEKRKKDEERIRKELEKARKEAEEKRQRDAVEKKRLKEQRKQEEEAKRKAAEEAKKQQEEERLRDQQQKEQIAVQQQQAHALNLKPAKAAPWSQATSNQGLSLAEIQKLERERKVEQQQELLVQQKKVSSTEQGSPEKLNAGLQLNWANKPLKVNQVKNFAEIQAEEQDRLVKQKEKEKAAAQKEKELAVPPPVATIWKGQSLTWSNSDGMNTGLWDEPCMTRLPQPQQQQAKSVQSKPKPSSAATKQQQSQSKNNTESANCNNITNSASCTSSTSSSSSEFTNWCVKTLDSMNTKVDIPTFVSFLRDIESALDVRDYCREYLGDRPATQQFAAQFLEKRRLFKPKHPAYKDDMCSPAPAITPHNSSGSDFQEVKGKGKKCKKSKMLKVDARILGFNVTAAQDRINVGDRDYGEA